MAFWSTVQVRFPDVDFARVVYYPRFFDYTHQVFEDFFEKEVGCRYADMLQHRKVGYPTVHAEADFQAPLRFGELTRIELCATRVSPRSIACRYRFFRGDSAEGCATLRCVVAPVEMDTFRPTTLPDDVRAAFERHLVVDSPVTAARDEP